MKTQLGKIKLTQPSRLTPYFSSNSEKRHSKEGGGRGVGRQAAKVRPAERTREASDLAASVPGTRMAAAAAAAMGPFEIMFKAAALAGNLSLGLGAVTKVRTRAPWT